MEVRVRSTLPRWPAARPAPRWTASGRIRSARRLAMGRAVGEGRGEGVLGGRRTGGTRKKGQKFQTEDTDRGTGATGGDRGGVAELRFGVPSLSLDLCELLSLALASPRSSKSILLVFSSRSLLLCFTICLSLSLSSSSFLSFFLLLLLIFSRSLSLSCSVSLSPSSPRKSTIAKHSFWRLTPRKFAEGSANGAEKQHVLFEASSRKSSRRLMFCRPTKGGLRRCRGADFTHTHRAPASARFSSPACAILTFFHSFFSRANMFRGTL